MRRDCSIIETYLFVEDTIVLVDVCDVSLVFVVPLAGKFALLLDTTD
jgi:hypothetical protein